MFVVETTRCGRSAIKEFIIQTKAFFFVHVPEDQATFPGEKRLFKKMQECVFIRYALHQTVGTLTAGLSGSQRIWATKDPSLALIKFS